MRPQAGHQRRKTPLMVTRVVVSWYTPPLISRRERIRGRICGGGWEGWRTTGGARWIPDWRLAVKLLESPEDEDGYTYRYISHSLFPRDLPLFLTLSRSFSHPFFHLHLRHSTEPPLLTSTLRRCLNPDREEDARSEIRYSSRHVASDVGAAVAGWWRRCWWRLRMPRSTGWTPRASREKERR